MIEIYSKKITLHNTTQDLQNAIHALEDFAKTCEIPSALMKKVNLMLSELLSNIMAYGYPKNKVGEIEIMLELFQTGKLSIKMTDKGIPFNPFQTTPPNWNIPLEERETGGLCLHLVRKLMDEYSYQRTFDLNVISMCKNQV